MQEARKQAELSNCQQTHWGAILVNWQGKIIGRGFNYVPDDQLLRHCNPCIRRNIRSCTQHEMCSARHAEVLCLENAAVEYGVDAAIDGDMYIYGYSEIEGNVNRPIIMEIYPCNDCAKAIIAAKVKRVFFYRPTAQNKEEELWLPKKVGGERLDLNSMRTYAIDFIEGKQLWFHPSMWLGLAGKTLTSRDVKHRFKLGQTYRPPDSFNKAYEYIKARLGDKIVYLPDDEEMSLIVWMIDQIMQDGYFDFAEYEMDFNKKMSMPKLFPPVGLDEVVTVEFIHHNFQIRRVRDDVRKTN